MQNQSLLLAALLFAAFAVVATQAQFGTVVGLRLVRSSTGTLVADLTNSTIIYLNNTTPGYTVVAVTSTATGPISGVRFRWNSNSVVRVDRTAPYTMCGGTFARCTNLTAGNHTITSSVINSTATYTVRFQLVRGSAPPIGTAPRAPVTAAPFTLAPLPPTKAPIKPPTKAPATAAPITKVPITKAPVTAAPVTAAPVTAAPVTAAPVASLAPALVPVTKAPVTAAPVTAAPVTAAPVTAAPVTAAPITKAPVTKMPVTTALPTLAPALAPVTAAPVTAAPVTAAPVTAAPVASLAPALVPVTKAPVTAAPVTAAPVTAAPVTAAPVTIAPTLAPALTPVTKAPVTFAPTLAPALTPVTKAPATVAPISKAPAIAPMAPSPSSSSSFDPIRINCGSAVPHTDALGRVWSADRLFTGGNTYDSNVAIAGTNEDPLYNCERYGQSTYSIPVPSGTYTVNLLYAEIYHTDENRRVFDVSVEGRMQADVDIVKLAGSAFTAYTRTVSNVTIVDGALTVRFLDNTPRIDGPKISAIEVLQSTAGVPTSAPIAPAPIAPVTPTANTFEPILINCGGGAFIDSQRRMWRADTFFVGGQTYETGADILGTEDDEIYNSNRYGEHQYNIPVPSGQYEIILHLSETYFQDPNRRVFDVSLETTQLADIDIVALGLGVGNTAVQQTTSAIVRDGTLNIIFKDNVPQKDFPTIAGIEISRLGPAPPLAAPTKAPVGTAPVTPVAPTPRVDSVRISCGAGADYTDAEGKVWLSDRFFQGGATYVNAGQAIAGTEDDTLFQSDRWGGEFSYQIPLPMGNYKVILHFAEVYFLFNNPESRVFDIDVEGESVLDVDIVKEAGAIYTAMKRETVIIPVTDGAMTIQFKQNIPQADNPKISAIEIVRAGDHASHSVSGGPYSAVDLDGSGFEMVPVSGMESHTHGLGSVLTTFTWKLGTTIVGSGEVTSLNIPVGTHELALTVVDSLNSVSTHKTTVTVKVKGFPELFTVSPPTGPIAGGTIVTLTGQDIGTATSVRFGRAVVTAITVIDSSTITVATPEAAVGVPVAVSVVTPIGESSSQRFTYIGSVAIEWQIQELMGIASPTALAFGPDGKLYVGTRGGKLGRFTLNDSYDTVVDSVISDRFPNNPDMCILGIAFDPMEPPELNNQISVYISLSRIYHGEYKNSVGNAINGKIQVVKGANLDQITTIVSGLPISEIDHAVNGIYFGDNGQLYMGVGSNTNAGLPGKLSITQRMRENYFSAAVLVANLAQPGFNGFITYDADIDGSPLTGFGPNGVEIFAAGTRNPYGVFVHSNGKVYATDNGSNANLGARATGCAPGQNATELDVGDKLLLLKPGSYHGHPNHKRAQNDPRQCVWRSYDEPGDAQYTATLLKVPSSTNGIVEFESDHFKGQLKGDLILSKYNDAIFRVILSADGETVNPFSDPMIRMAGQGGLAVVQAPDGSLIDARFASNKLFLYKPVEDPQTDLEVKSVFPRRGGLAGGSKLLVFGVNFSGTPTVTVGGNACTSVVLVSATKLECILPVGTVGRKDVIVTIGAASDTFANAYRYITGLPA